MITLTILNTLLIIYLILQHKLKYYIGISKKETFWKNTLLGYQITLWKELSEYSANAVCSIYIPIKNRHKTKLREEIERLMDLENPTKINSLTAKFSWLKTWDDVRQFEKDYSIVDPDYVKKLVSNFTPKSNG